MNAFTPAMRAPVAENPVSTPHNSPDMIKAGADAAGVAAGTAIYTGVSSTTLAGLTAGATGLLTGTTGSLVPAAGMAAVTAAELATGIPFIRIGAALVTGLLTKKAVEMMANMIQASAEVARRTGSIVKGVLDKAKKWAGKIKGAFDDAAKEAGSWIAPQPDLVPIPVPVINRFSPRPT